MSMVDGDKRNFRKIIQVLSNLLTVRSKNGLPRWLVKSKNHLLSITEVTGQNLHESLGFCQRCMFFIGWIRRFVNLNYGLGVDLGRFTWILRFAWTIRQCDIVKEAMAILVIQR